MGAFVTLPPRKTADIPQEPILERLAAFHRKWNGTRWMMRFSEAFAGEASILPAFPPDTHEKLVLSKMRSLIKRGLVDGCYCGCRGDYRLTAKGRAQVEHDQRPFVNLTPPERKPLLT